MGDREPYMMEINGDETSTFPDGQTSQTEVAVSDEGAMAACDRHLHDAAVSSRINCVIPEEEEEDEEIEAEEAGEDSGKVDPDLENSGVSEVLLVPEAVKSPLQQETLTTADDAPPSEESEKVGNSAAISENHAVRPISATPDDNPHDNQDQTDENGDVTDDEAIAGDNDKSALTCDSDKTSQTADESQNGTFIKDVVESGELDVNSSCGSGNDSDPLDIKAEVVSCCDTSFALPGRDKDGSMENIDSIAKDLTPDVENCADTFSAHVLAEGKNASDASTLETASPERQAALIPYVDSPLSENLESGFVDMLSPTTDSERRPVSETSDQDLVTDGVEAFFPTIRSGDDSGLWVQNEDPSPECETETNTGVVESGGSEAVSNASDAQRDSVETFNAECESRETTLDSGGAGSENLEAELDTGGTKSDLAEDYLDAKKDLRGTDQENVHATGALHLEAEKAEPATDTEQSLAASDGSASPERQGTASSSSSAAQPSRGTVKGTAVRQGSSIARSNVMSSASRRRMDLVLPQKVTMEDDDDVAYLRQELHDKTRVVQRLQTTLYEQQARANVAVINLRTQLRQRDLQARHVRQEHEQRMKALLTHLLYLEGQMRQEQKQVLQALQRKEETMQEKDDVIRRQRSAIADLTSKNEKLLAALKEAHGYSGTNGLLSSASAPTSSSSVLPPGSPGTGATPSPVVLRNKDKQKGQSKVIFGSVKDKLRRHRSSLELHRPASLETLLEGTLRYGSQENIAAPALETPVSLRPAAGKGAEGLSSDEVKKNRLLERKERCRSMVDYPSRLNDLPEVSSEVEKDQPHSDNGGGDEGFGSSSVVSSSSRNSDPTSVSSASFLSDPLYEQFRGGRSPASSLSSFSSPQHLPSSTPQGRDSLYSDEDEAFASSSPGGDDVCAGRGGCPADARDGTGKVRAPGELTKAASMPYALSSAAALDHNGAHSPQSPPKERPVSLPGMEVNLMERMTMQPQVSMCPSPTGHAAPGGSESNPFKSIKNVFMRRNSKQRSKKQRPVSVGQMSSGDQSHQQLQEHFRKYDLS